VLEKFFERVEESYREKASKTAKRHAAIEKSVSGIKQKLNVIERKQDNLFHQQAEGHLDTAQWERLNRDLSEQAEALRIEIASADADKALSPTYEGNIREDWERMTLDERRHALGLFVERVIIKPGRGPDRIEIVWRD
jgi:putative heme degradation protein